MRDALEEHLANRLGTLGDTVGDDLPLPADLELRVRRRRRHIRARRRWSGLAVAAAVVVASTTLAVVHGSSRGSSLRIESSSSTTPTPAHLRDALQPGTVMLSARGRYVVSLDANGHTNATMINAKHGDIAYARATDDHSQLWYLSSIHGPSACGDVVRADIAEGHSSTIVTEAVSFDVSPDGSRLALYGGGDLAHGHCSPVKAGGAGHIVVIDLASAASSAMTMSNVTSLRWSPDGSYLVAVSCAAIGCQNVQRIDVPVQLGARLVDRTSARVFVPNSVRSSSATFGPDGLYDLTRSVSAAHPGAMTTTNETIGRYDSRTLAGPEPVFGGGGAWDVTQVIPAATATYVVAAPTTIPVGAKVPVMGPAGLYRIVAGGLVFVRSLDSPGNLTPVTPFRPGA